ncbi:2-methylthioadenine synthetase [Prochlorococcus marinus subsp. marinus str. CCMP1375]|uniref:Ribosomal protein uS12 methylthiotransferase RimO n=1 Tax=Prochlorococcus marinus (strain SARG / CCMP1375 / SS120) TaxID=167539 RepID=RIMO_PROMA|nr:RecName: Full=Ribosomal protein uS12 methylthiotransferase RimO; Short=uS12 MTTase; Short=uS12 methylthiotransferase; AltName: Full=Ribosomal protein uS12 (aspartate-C(3))-methylthiotransferase; AltName: Full=Ribosome maturation factor RimO [Prochlorococcus marinus subsp. marinus str. CCMP1375]AAP99167.1 2-methylthioadenine synthetase [Prochlorococcus marinus subsp. marinus str. CCMP1375]
MHLGCEKNLVDTEHMMGLLDQGGYSISTNPSEASLVVVNTCSFIQDAREESVRVLVGLAEQDKEIIIAGCLAQHFQEELLQSIPEAKAIIGTGDYQNILNVLQRIEQGEIVNQVSNNPTFVGDEKLPRFRTTGKAVAYLKIAEGCDYSCAFCIIPKLRGMQRSRSIESIVAEANQLAKQGVKELILISQITTNYGLDLYGRPCLADLLRELGDVEIPWIRVHYAYPTGLTSEVIKAFREVPNLLPYLDLPLQHSHPDVLRLMNRPWQLDLNASLLDRIRSELPDAIFRTSLIVGFPGETEEHFNHLVSFVQTQQFDHIGVFTFSSEAGTKAASLANQIPFSVAEARKDKIISIQQPIAELKNQNWIGRTVDVLIEREDKDSAEFVGRCARFSPEVDGFVRLQINNTFTNQLNIGMMTPALITGADLYDLTGQVV